MEYYSIMKNNQMTFTGKWMEPEVMLCELRRAVISYVKTRKKGKHKDNTNIVKDVLGKDRVARGEGNHGKLGGRRLKPGFSVCGNETHLYEIKMHK